MEATPIDRSRAPGGAVHRAGTPRRARTSSPRCRSRPPRQTLRTAQIPIAPAASSYRRAAARGFVPWRLADAGRRARPVVATGRHPQPFTLVACRRGFFLPVRVLSKLFRRLMLQRLAAAHAQGRLVFFAGHAPLADDRAFAAFLAPLRKTKWFVYSKRPFAGPQAVLAYLSRYTHRVAISNSRLIACDDEGVTFRWKDYRADGRARYKTMTLATPEFIRRFLLHVLPPGFHRIRHYGLFANGQRRDAIARARQLLDAASAEAAATKGADTDTAAEAGDPAARPAPRCPCCGGRMIVVETFAAGVTPRRRPSAVGLRIDTS